MHGRPSWLSQQRYAYGPAMGTVSLSFTCVGTLMIEVTCFPLSSSSDIFISSHSCRNFHHHRHRYGMSVDSRKFKINTPLILTGHTCNFTPLFKVIFTLSILIKCNMYHFVLFFVGGGGGGGEEPVSVYYRKHTISTRGNRCSRAHCAKFQILLQPKSKLMGYHNVQDRHG